MAGEEFNATRMHAASTAQDLLDSLRQAVTEQPRISGQLILDRINELRDEGDIQALAIVASILSGVSHVVVVQLAQQAAAMRVASGGPPAVQWTAVEDEAWRQIQKILP